jgi:uncharacterized protein
MSRIIFENERPPAEVDPARTDVACFVGLIRNVPGATLPPAVVTWLTQRGWIGGRFARYQVTSPPTSPPTWPIEDIPIPIETYPAFTALFDAGGSPQSFGTDYVAAAVRTFFAQGGKRCYVVRMDDPVAPGESSASKSIKLSKLLPTTTDAQDDQRGWHGAGHLNGLPDVSFLALPDLPILTASLPVQAIGNEPAAPSAPAQFLECAPPDVVPPTPAQYLAAAPRLTPDDYASWAAAVRSVTQFLANGGNLREMLLVAAFPLPLDTDVAAASENPSDALTQDLHDVISAQMPEALGEGISTAFLQLAYPWLRTSGSNVLLEGLEPPDGALTGILARNALTRGTFASATKVTPAEIFDLVPLLPAQETTVPATPPTWGDHSPPKPLIERLSLFGFTPLGLALLSDVTTYPGESYRAGRIHRLVAVILRASRGLGETIVFQQNGPALWARVQSFLRQLMTRLWQANALDGATLDDAFSVRCDLSTMTQNDLDNGRLVAVVMFQAAATIELIRVTLALETSGTSVQSIAAEAS